MNTDPTELPDTTAGVDTDPDAVRRAIRARAEDIERRELREALDRLEARGTLTAEQRRIVSRMATAIVDDVLAAPEAALRDAPDTDSEPARTAIGLFDPDR